MIVTYVEWLPLFGLPANDPAVVAALAAHGVNAPVVLRPQELTVNVDFLNDGMSVGFTSEYALRGGVADLPVVSSIVMVVIRTKASKKLPPYVGPLPHGLQAANSKDAAVALLGEPFATDADFCTASWMIDGRRLSVRFTEDWKSVKQLGLSIPREN